MSVGSISDSEVRDQLPILNYDHESQVKTEDLSQPPDVTVVNRKSGPIKKPLSAWQEEFHYEDLPGKSWNEFFQETTFHGVKYIFEDSPFKYRKITWAVVVVVAIALFTWQVGERVNTYYKYQTTVDVEVIYTQTIDFPAVTICNQNSFRQTAAVDMGLYDFIDKLYESQNYTGIDFSNYDLDINSDNFAKMTAHQLEDFVDSCKWHSKPCDMPHDFTMTLTDIGVCYTFNGQTKPRQVTESGAGSGLSLVLNVEQYEYMRGPQNDAGVKILLHAHGETPLMKDMGFAAAPGTHTLVAVNRKEVISMPAPYGHCKLEGQRMSNCLAQCKTEYIMEKCHCRDAYMPDFNITQWNQHENDTVQVSYPVCDLTAKYKCVEYNLEILQQQESRCACPVSCNRVLFSPSLSYAHLSAFNVDRLVLTDPERKDTVNNQFLHAMEVSQRTIKKIAEHDHELMNTIIGLGNALTKILRVTKPKMKSIKTFSESYGYPDVISGGMKAVQTDYEKLFVRMFSLYNEMNNILSSLTNTYTLQQNLNTLLDIQDNTSRKVEDLQACIPAQSTIGTTEREVTTEAINSSSGMSDDFSSNDDPFFLDPGLMFYSQFYGLYNLFDDPLEGLSPECKELFTTTKSAISCLSSWYGGPHEELKRLPNTYESFLNAWYPNSTNTDLDHKVCNESMMYVSNTYAPIAENIVNVANEYGWNVKSIGDLVDGVERLYNATSNSDFLNNSHWMFHYRYSWGSAECKSYYDVESGNIANCSWIMDMASSFKNIHESMYELLYTQESVTTQQAMTNAEISFSDASVAIQKLSKNANQKLLPIVRGIKDYLNGNITKQRLAYHFESVTVQETLTQLATLQAELESSLHDFSNYMKAMDEFIIKGYKLFMDTPVPVLHSGNIFDLNLYQDIKDINSSFLIELQNATTDEFARVAAEILEEVFEGYVIHASEIRANITPILSDLTLKMNIMQKEMIAYSRQSEMGENFYMHNFLQVDIFYGELSYQKVEQIPTFEILSLFGEIGGFLGLLLGASIITICELVDYITILIVKFCHKKKAVDPGLGRKGKWVP